MRDVIVVGGGAMGLSTAWHAARQGLDVLVLEQFRVGHDQGSSHGAGRIFRLAYPDRRYVSLALRARELWTELEDAAGVSLLTVTGGLDHGAIDELSPALGDIRHFLLSPTEAAERWPALRFEGSVLLQPDAGVIDADRTVSALHRLAVQAGAEVREDVRVGAVRQGTVVADDQELRARVVVVAAGAWAGPLLGRPFRVTQEQPAFFPTSADLPVFIHHPPGTTPQLGPAHYGLPVPGQGLKVGAHGTGPVVDPTHRPPVDPARVAQLSAYVREWLPGVSAEPSAVDSCLYTSTPDEEFVLERRGDLVICSPCSGHGFKFVPAIGEITARLAAA